MATYYARNVTGNWASNTSWDSASSGGDGPAGPPIAGDTAIFDSGFTGNITIAASAACATLTAQAGATGTLTWSTYALTVSADVTFVTGFHVAGTGGSLSMTGAGATLTTGGISIGVPSLLLSGAGKTLNTDGTTWTAITITSSGTYTLTSNLQATTLNLTGPTSPVFAGDHDISVGTFNVAATGAVTLTLRKLRKLCIATGAGIGMASLVTTIKSDSATEEPAYIEFTGANANALKVVNCVFTDVDFSTYSTPVTNLDNWYGGTLTRTSGITNRTSADIGGGTGGVTGRCIQLGVGVC